MSNGGLDRSQIKQYLVPAVGIAAVVLLVGLVVVVSGDNIRRMADGSTGSANDPDLKEAAPGVKYRDIKVGTGEPCQAGTDVQVHYTGWLTDGTVFDSTREGSSATGTPLSVKLTSASVIPGWVAGIPGMKPGGIRKLVISPEMGYGRANREPIPPNSILIFEVELVSIAPPKFLTSGPGQPMPHDNSNGGTDDPGLKDIGGGLKIRDLKEGTGEPVKEGATVTIHYVGWTIEGKVFDSSRARDKPATFSLRNLIAGWQKGIPGMKPGGVRKLVVPASLGYGEKGSGDAIPGGATLIFEVELIK